MFSTYPQFLLSDVQSTPVFWFNTSYGIKPETFASDPLLSKYFNILSNSFDKNGNQFVSSIESKKWPIFAVQFHPEKAAFEWDSSTYSHKYTAITASQLIINQLIDQSRENKNVFPSSSVEDGCLIYNVNSTMISGLFSPVYLFKNTQSSCLVTKLGGAFNETTDAESNESENVESFTISDLFDW